MSDLTTFGIPDVTLGVILCKSGAAAVLLAIACFWLAEAITKRRGRG